MCTALSKCAPSLTAHCNPRRSPEYSQTVKTGEKEKGLHESCFHGTARILRNVTVFCWPSGPNAISVSLSPMGRYVMVGLASRRILLHPSTEHMVAQVFRLQQAHGGETSMRVSVIVYISSRLGRVMRDYDISLCRASTLVQRPVTSLFHF